MTRTFAIAAVAALMCVSVALAAEDAQKPAAGGADTSSGAKEQSSAPPGSEAKEDLSGKSTAGTSSDTAAGGASSVTLLLGPRLRKTYRVSPLPARAATRPLERKNRARPLLARPLRA